MFKINYFIIICLFFLSCGGINKQIKRNDKKTSSLYEELLDENKNAFALNSTYFNFSRVWTYKRDKIVVFDLKNGKIQDTRIYGNSNNDWLNFAEDDIKPVATGGCLELDGDLMRYSIIKDDALISVELPISIECFLKAENHSRFYKELAKDIETYKLELYNGNTVGNRVDGR